MVQVTNALVDARISSESAPLTRVTNVDDLFPAATNTDQIRIEFTSTLGNTVYLSYEELAINDLWEHAIMVADGINGLLDDLDTQLAAVRAAIAGFTPPYTYDNWREIHRLMTDAILNPWKGY